MAFMIPEAEYLTLLEAREYLDDPEAEEGWYGRLSAPGYMDCTEWSGPFDKAWKALRNTCNMFEVDIRGEDLAV